MNKSSLGIKSGVVPDHFCRMAPTCFSLTLVWTTRYYESAFTQAPAIQLIIVAAAFASARRRARGRHWADATTDVARGGSQLDTLATTGKTKYRRPITSTGRRSPSTSEVLVVNSDVQQLNPLFNWYLRSGPLDFREDTVAHGKWWETIRTLCVCVRMEIKHWKNRASSALHWPSRRSSWPTWAWRHVYRSAWARPVRIAENLWLLILVHRAVCVVHVPVCVLN